MIGVDSVSNEYWIRQKQTYSYTGYHNNCTPWYHKFSVAEKFSDYGFNVCKSVTSYKGNHIHTTKRMRKWDDSVYFDGTLETKDFYSYTCDLYRRKIIYECKGWLPNTCVSAVEPADLEYQISLLKEKLTQKVIRHTSALYTTLAELRSTADGLEKFANNLARGLNYLFVHRDPFKACRALGGSIPRRETRQYKNLKKRTMYYKNETHTEKVADVSLALAENWLFYRYGWTPFYHDIINYAESAAQNLLKPKRKVFKVNSSSSYPEHTKYSNVAAYSYAYAYIGAGRVNFNGVSCRTTYQREVNFSLWMSCNVDWSGMDRSLNYTHGTSISHLPLAAWELVPFSFFFDKFMDVSTWLANKTMFNGLIFEDAGYTFEIEQRNNHYIYKIGDSRELAHRTSRGYLFKRFPLDQHQLYYNIYELTKNDWSWKQTLDSISMVFKRFSSKL